MAVVPVVWIYIQGVSDRCSEQVDQGCPTGVPSTLIQIRGPNSTNTPPQSILPRPTPPPQKTNDASTQNKTKNKKHSSHFLCSDFSRNLKLVGLFLLCIWIHVCLHHLWKSETQLHFFCIRKRNHFNPSQWQWLTSKTTTRWLVSVSWIKTHSI